MSSAFRPVAVILIVVGAMLGFSLLRKARAPVENIPWRKNLEAAKGESAKTGKPVLAYFTATWCPPCQQMKEETWPDKRVESALEAYVPVKIDVDVFPDVARRYDVDGIPVIAVLRADGTPIESRVGFATADELAGWLKEAAAAAGTTDASSKIGGTGAAGR